MKTRLLAVSIVVLAVCFGIVLVAMAQGAATQDWVQVNSDGFGNQQNSMISALSPFNGELYAGTYNAGGTGAQIWRLENTGWSAVITNGLGITRNAGIDQFFPFNGQLYVGTWSDEVNGGEIWRSSNGLNWTRIITEGFGDPINAEIYQFATFSNTLYASTWSYITNTHGTEIWRSTTGNTGDWTRVVTDGFNSDSDNASVVAFEIFNGYLYAGTANQATGGEVWRSPTGDSNSWIQVNPDGFGDASNGLVTAFAIYDGYLYASTHHFSGAGAQVWRCQICDNSDWTKVVDNGFGNVDTRRQPALEVFNDALYFVAGNSVTGMEVWRTSNGTQWEQVGFSGFGDNNNRATLYDSPVTVFNNSLYIGTINSVTGGEIWLFLHRRVFLPLVQK